MSLFLFFPSSRKRGGEIRKYFNLLSTHNHGRGKGKAVDRSLRPQRPGRVFHVSLQFTAASPQLRKERRREKGEVPGPAGFFPFLLWQDKKTGKKEKRTSRRVAAWSNATWKRGGGSATRPRVH